MLHQPDAESKCLRTAGQIALEVEQNLRQGGVVPGKGRDIAEGMSRILVITSEEIYEAISDSLEQIIQAIRQALEKTPPELSADIGEKGMVIAGGGALLRDMDRRLMQDTGLPVVLAEEPMTCVVLGCGRALEEMDALGDVFAIDG